MAQYLSPGVYIEENNSFPNAIQSAPTGIPAFVGYTQKLGAGDALLKKPTRISSFLEFEQHFGGPNPVLKISLADDGTFVESDVQFDPQTHFMYYSLQLFFANGGGPCYIVSVGKYPVPGPGVAQVSKATLLDGLAALDRVDEPSLLYFPDLKAIAPQSPAANRRANRDAVIQQALAHCAGRKDRFLIIDMFDDAETFRTGLGTDGLSYGAAYTPELETALGFQPDDSQITFLVGASASDEAKRFSGQTLAFAMAEIENAKNYDPAQQPPMPAPDIGNDMPQSGYGQVAFRPSSGHCRTATHAASGRRHRRHLRRH